MVASHSIGRGDPQGKQTSVRCREADCAVGHENRMISGCPVDQNILTCLIHYAPEVMLLLVLALSGIAAVAMRSRGR